MPLNIYVDASKFEAFKNKANQHGHNVMTALRASAADAAHEIESRGAADIASAGNFGSRWTEGLHADVRVGGGNIRIDVSHEVPYWRVFEMGATIQPKTQEYLWIPFSFATDAKGVWPRDYGNPLFRVTSKTGLPMLWTWQPGVKGSAEPKYFGKSEVHIPQKFHIRDIVRKVGLEVKQYYREHMKR